MVVLPSHIINHVLNRLITMCIVAHVHYLHFTDFVDYAMIVTLVKQWWNGKDRVEHLDKIFFTSHQFDETCRVVEHRPCVMPAVAFRESITPFEW